MVRLRINDLLEEKGRTAYWLAIETGINHAVIAKLRYNRAKSIRFDVLESLCRVLECAPTDLLDIAYEKPERTRKPKTKA
jgi:putative transcriptional regulator